MSNVLRSAAAAALLLFASVAHAQIFRAYLTDDGNDANPCTLTQPCRLLPAALAAVASGGEIWLLDSANFNTGPVTISKSVTILAVPGVVGSFVALGGSALIINTNGLSVQLLNLNVVPFPGSEFAAGVDITGGSRVIIEKCRFSGFGSNGTGVRAVSPFAPRVLVADSTFVRNARGMELDGASAAVSRSLFTANVVGINATATANQRITVVAVSDSEFTFNNNGVLATTGAVTGPITRAEISDSTFKLNLTEAVHVIANAAATSPQVSATLTRSTLASNDTGIQVENTGASATLAGTTITRNNIGYFASGVIDSAGDNVIRGNGSNSGALSPFAKQ